MLEYIGYNSIDNLERILKLESFRNIFLVTGKKSFENTKIKQIIYNSLRNFNFFQFNNFTPNPKIEDIENGLQAFQTEKFDVIIAVGGGSVIDMAKCISIFSTNEGTPEQLILKKKPINKKGVPLIRVPTTSGSGSEATHFAVVYIKKNKHSLAEPKYMHPEYVIIDPQFMYDLPKNITAYSGMDALTQAIESFWNINSTVESKNYSEKAIKLIMENLLKAVLNPDKKSRLNMAVAANYAGKAINITKTTACHAISYPITSYFNVPHGHAVALSLPPMIVYNSNVNEGDVLDSRGVKFVRRTMKELISIIGASNALKAKEVLSQLMKNIDLETKLGELGIKTKEDIDVIVKNGFNPERVKNNPRKLDEYQLRAILEEIR